MPIKPLNSSSRNGKILDYIKANGPVTAITISTNMNISTQVIQSGIGMLRTKYKINVQKKGKKTRKETLHYFFDPEYPIIDGLSLTEQKEEEEEQALFDELVIKDCSEYQNGPKHKEPLSTRERKGIDALVDRCHHLIQALEFCSNGTIMDNFNLNEDQARVLVNKVAARYSDISVSFSVSLKKEKINGQKH